MPSNRQARINRLKAAFKKAEELMNEGYVVQLDGETITGFVWGESSLMLEVVADTYVTRYMIYDVDQEFGSDYADMKMSFIDEFPKDFLNFKTNHFTENHKK